MTASILHMAVLVVDFQGVYVVLPGSHITEIPVRELEALQCAKSPCSSEGCDKSNVHLMLHSRNTHSTIGM